MNQKEPEKLEQVEEKTTGASTTKMYSRIGYAMVLIIAILSAVLIYILPGKVGDEIADLEQSMKKLTATQKELSKNTDAMLATIKQFHSPYTGIGVQFEMFNLEPSGTMVPIVKKVMCNGPAYQAGIKPGDEFFRLNQQSMYFSRTDEGYSTYGQLLDSVASSEVGTLIPIKVRYEDKNQNVTYKNLSVPVAEIPPLNEWPADCKK